jgi:hypothetical protein
MHSIYLQDLYSVIGLKKGNFIVMVVDVHPMRMGGGATFVFLMYTG